MAHYTTQIRSIVEQINLGHSFQPSETDGIRIIDERIEHARPYIFSFYYPINSADKDRFEHNFIRHFYTREIGFETYGLWRLKLADELNMIIPKYNKLWEEATKYVDRDLLSNSDYSTIRNYTGLKNLNGTDSLNGIRTDNLREQNNGIDIDTNKRNYVIAYSDTPQGNMENLLDEKYLTNLTHEYDNDSKIIRDKNATKTNTGTVNTSNTQNKNERVNDEQNEVVRHVGKNGGITYAEALLKARETYLNIDLMLCNDMRDLFMLIW